MSTAANLQTPPKRRQPSALNNTYLIAYNFVSASLWAIVLGRTLAHAASVDPAGLFWEWGTWVRWTQTLALLEVVHAAVGIVRAPLVTTAMQVASRIVLVWGVGYVFPSVPASNPAYISMLFAWAFSEIIRYSYFVVFLASGEVPAWLLWFRYNAFYVLYPVGISSECWLMWKATGPAAALNPLYAYAFYAILAIYAPGSYILYTHMMAQRRKVMRGKQPAKK